MDRTLEKPLVCESAVSRYVNGNAIIRPSLFSSLRLSPAKGSLYRGLGLGLSPCGCGLRRIPWELA